MKKVREEYTKIENITTNSYTISELKENVKYEIYLTGVNELGESDPSLTEHSSDNEIWNQQSCRNTSRSIHPKKDK
ncbi:MAG: fibronectin type III domain-containing protein [Blautia sp.]